MNSSSRASGAPAEAVREDRSHFRSGAGVTGVTAACHGRPGCVEHPGATEDAEDVPCKPQLAEKCWSDVVGHVDCLLNPRSTRTHVCQRLNHTELCKVLEDALRCSTDVAENGCVLRSGRENFDFWIRGLEAVNTKLCFEGQMATVVAYAECWDVLRFTRCVQHTVDRLQHVVDLADLLTPHHGHDGHDGHGDLAAGEQLRAADSRQQCHLAMLRLSTCGATAATLNPAPVLADPMRSCLQAAPVDVINEMLAAYFSASECGNGGGGSGGSPCPSYGLPHQEALAFTTTLAALTEPPPAAPIRCRY
ncbi:uncharacterized protein LOC117651960 [Thrips palmi]|uniref:Uncharacterized protein LOC117651960 n=1 Tax=Thrips palmi TaxID=161013 RepID=A0A6P9A3P1_THRPL|nr:uncharacterized protein LOC117651960 [Thrips palmi]